MARLDSLETLLIEEMRDLMDAERQLTKALPQLAKAASAMELRTAFEEHLEQTNTHIERLNQAFRAMDAEPRAKKCPGIRGIIEEGSEHLEGDGDTDVIDAALIADAQKTEHYEIASYGTAATHARRIGRDEVAALLEETLQEEKDTDQRLTEIAERMVNPSAAHGNGISAHETGRSTSRRASSRGNGQANGRAGGGSMPTRDHDEGARETTGTMRRRSRGPSRSSRRSR